MKDVVFFVLGVNLMMWILVFMFYGSTTRMAASRPVMSFRGWTRKKTRTGKKG